MNNRIIDPHIHLFNLQQGQYHWLKAETTPFWADKAKLQRNFSMSDLNPGNQLQLAGVTHIEAGFNNQEPVLELDFLAREIHSVPYCAIAFADISSATSQFNHSLEQLQAAARFSGIRHITEGADTQLLFAEPVADNLARLASQRLIFEVQFELSNLKASRQLASYARSLPNLTIVINHAGLVSERYFSQWQSALELLAPYPNIYLKCSGWEMNDRQYKKSWLDKVIATSVQYFGPGRVMLASNFPICLLSCSYADLWQNYRQLELDSNLWSALSFDNANKTYRFAISPNIS